MLIIPEKIKVSRALGAEKTLMEMSRKFIEGEARAEGIHVSDLMDPLLAYWNRVNKLPLSDGSRHSRTGTWRAFHRCPGRVWPL